MQGISNQVQVRLCLQGAGANQRCCQLQGCGVGAQSAAAQTCPLAKPTEHNGAIAEDQQDVSHPARELAPAGVVAAPKSGTELISQSPRTGQVSWTGLC